METEIIVPIIELSHFELLSITYTINPLVNLSDRGDMSFNIRLYGKHRNKFRVRLVTEIHYKTAKFRARYSAEFEHKEPISHEEFRSELLQNEVVNYLLPFNTELFAHISSKSFGRPIIAPSSYSQDEELQTSEGNK
jgi:hypothetical protein